MPYRLGFWAVLMSLAATVGYCAAEIMHFIGRLDAPLYDILVYGFSIFIATPFVIAMTAMHYTVAEPKHVWTHSALMVAGMYAVLVSLVYAIELTVTIPAQMQGSEVQVQFLLYKEHTFLAAIDGLGYVLMSLSTLLAAGAFSWRGLEGWLKLLFVANGLVAPLIVLILYCHQFLLIGAVWMLTAPGSMLLMAVWFLRTKPSLQD